MNKHNIDISCDFPELSFQPHEILKIFHTLGRLKDYTVPSGDLSIAFVDDATIAKIHNDFMSDPTPTDVITFPGDPELDFAGEIIVSFDHAKSNSLELNTPFHEELTLYLVHGWLHLAGLDDIEEADRVLMREGEAIAMDLLKKENSIPNFSLNP